ncbi:hypothetical protein [Crocosphaera chwakensis]|uniref:Uncharacterized protein n=1 Tax=Crocosphaera chwakensis CCY0110 TaxID=391612 RepID=A3J013_9CHRO|nr:hypothetical protein [Crocosphaera chwakensis]EAZ87937.1 hypothetical protein CY0110_00835 [Crocosphaera chwakensis CCY0110]
MNILKFFATFSLITTGFLNQSSVTYAANFSINLQSVSLRVFSSEPTNFGFNPVLKQDYIGVEEKMASTKEEGSGIITKLQTPFFQNLLINQGIGEPGFVELINHYMAEGIIEGKAGPKPGLANGTISWLSPGIRYQNMSDQDIHLKLRGLYTVEMKTENGTTGFSVKLTEKVEENQIKLGQISKSISGVDSFSRTDEIFFEIDTVIKPNEVRIFFIDAQDTIDGKVQIPENSSLTMIFILGVTMLISIYKRKKYITYNKD